MSEPTDREIEEQTDRRLDAQIAELEEERRNPPINEERYLPKRTPPKRPKDRESQPGYMTALAGLTEWANALRLASIPEEDWALVANHLRTIEIDLAEKRREIESEATAVAQAARTAEPLGKKMVYESDRGALVEQVKRTYSYNTNGLILALIKADQAHSPGEAIQIYQQANALELKWKVSFLENIADRLGFDLPKAHHEIEDGDPDYLVGVVSTSKMGRG